MHLFCLGRIAKPPYYSKGFIRFTIRNSRGDNYRKKKNKTSGILDQCPARQSLLSCHYYLSRENVIHTAAANKEVTHPCCLQTAGTGGN